jgi:lipopolysaccharide export system permease protein
MSVAAKYLNRELIGIFIVTLLVLLAVALGGRVINYLQDAAMGKYTGATVLTIIALRLPEFIQQVAPFAMYVAIVMTLGRLYADQEMVILQGGGVGTAKLLKWLSACVFAVAGLVALLAWVFTPLSQKVLVEYLAEQRAASEFEGVSAGTFHAYDKGTRVTYSRTLSEDRKVLYDVFLSQRLERSWTKQAARSTCC